MDQTEMVRLATIPPAQLLAQTRSALLLVDVQNLFIFGGDPASPASTVRVLRPLAALLQAARSQVVPRFFVTSGHAASAGAAPLMRRLNDMGVDVKGRIGAPALPASAWTIPDEIAPRPDETHLIKWRFSAFYETGLDFHLNGAGIETVVLGGVASYACIIATYLDALSRGFFPLLCADAVDGIEPTMHKAAMDFMGPSRLSVDAIVQAWNAL